MSSVAPSSSIGDASQEVRRVAVFVDGSEPGDSAFNAALRWRKSNDFLYVVHVPEVVSLPIRGIVYLQSLDDTPFQEANQTIKKNSEHLVTHYAQRAKESGVPQDSVQGFSLPLCSSAKTAAVEFCEKNHISVAFVGSRGIGTVQRILLGSFSEYLVSHTPCDVMVIRGKVAPKVASAAASANSV